MNFDDEYERMLDYSEMAPFDLSVIDYAKCREAINFSDCEYAKQPYTFKYGRFKNPDFVHNTYAKESVMKDEMLDFFSNFAFSPDWAEVQSTVAAPEMKQEDAPCVNRKDVETLLGELDEIEDKLNEINARKWHLAKLMKLHTAQ